MQWYDLPGPLTARAPRHVPYVPQWLIRPWCRRSTVFENFKSPKSQCATGDIFYYIFNAVQATYSYFHYSRLANLRTFNVGHWLLAYYYESID